MDMEDDEEPKSKRKRIGKNDGSNPVTETERPRPRKADDRRITVMAKRFPFMISLASELSRLNQQADRNACPAAFFSILSKFESSLSTAMVKIRDNEEKSRLLANNLGIQIMEIAAFGHWLDLWEGEFGDKFQCALTLLSKHYVNAKLLSYFNSDTSSRKEEAWIVYMFVTAVFNRSDSNSAAERVLDTFLASNICDHGQADESIERHILFEIIKDPARYIRRNSSTARVCKFLALLETYTRGGSATEPQSITNILSKTKRYLDQEINSEIIANMPYQGFRNASVIKLLKKTNPLKIINEAKSQARIARLDGEETQVLSPICLERDSKDQTDIDLEENHQIVVEEMQSSFEEENEGSDASEDEEENSLHVESEEGSPTWLGRDIQDQTDIDQEENEQIMVEETQRSFEEENEGSDASEDEEENSLHVESEEEGIATMEKEEDDGRGNVIEDEDEEEELGTVVRSVESKKEDVKSHHADGKLGSDTHNEDQITKSQVPTTSDEGDDDDILILEEIFSSSGASDSEDDGEPDLADGDPLEEADYEREQRAKELTTRLALQKKLRE